MGGTSVGCEAVFADGSFDCVVEVFACVAAGVQIALVDAQMPDEVAAKLVSAADADALWVGAHKGNRALVEEALLAKPVVPRRAHNNILFFTSGTTALAKPVMLSDESLMAAAYNGSSLMPLTADDTLMCMLPLAHVFGFVCGLLWRLACGARVALGRGPRHYFDDLAFFHPTAVSVVPALLKLLVGARLFNPELKLVLVGAAACPPELAQATRAAGVRISVGYGMTETSSGLALPLGEDTTAMTVCPDDTITVEADGSLLVKAPTCIMRGYYKRPEETAAVLPDGPAGVLVTGDVGYWDERGLIHVTGRARDVIALPTGEKVYLPEYEAALASALGEKSVAVVSVGGRQVLVREQAEHRVASDQVMDTVRGCAPQVPRDARVGTVVDLDHPFLRTAAGDVQRWKVQEEVKSWQPNRK